MLLTLIMYLLAILTVFGASGFLIIQGDPPALPGWQ
jgi:hypothetical protein